MKRIIISIVLSFVGPGLGQIYNKEFKKGIFLIVVSTALFLLPSLWLAQKARPFLPNPAEQTVTRETVRSILDEVITKEQRHILSVISFLVIGIYAYAITQAYFKAKEMKDAESEEGRPDSDVQK